MDDVITETTSSISIQWRVFCTYIVSKLEMSPFKSVCTTLVYTTFNYAPRTRHAAASPWCLLPLPELAHAFGCVTMGVTAGMALQTPIGQCSPVAAAYGREGCMNRNVEGRQALLWRATLWQWELVSSWEGLNHTPTLHSVAAAAASPQLSIKRLTCGRSVLSSWSMYGYLHEQTLFSFI